MIDFLQYILSEVKNKKITKKDGIDLVRQYQSRNTPQYRDYIHPMLHQNTSDFSEQRFSSVFTGREFFLKDYVIKGQTVLPGVAYLEMARAAVAEAAGISNGNQACIKLKNVVCTLPVVVENVPVGVHTGLTPEDSGEISYEIYSQKKDGSGEVYLHSKGSAVISEPCKLSKIDIPLIRKGCKQTSLSSAQCYNAYRDLGFDYGPGFRGIERLYVGKEQVLAKLSLSAAVSESVEEYILHPGLMDSALQASLGLMIDSGKNELSEDMDNNKTYLPFALEELVIYGKCTPDMWALVRYSEGCKTGDRIRKLDIDLCDKLGNVCVQFRGFSYRPSDGKTAFGGVREDYGTLLFEPCWKEQSGAFKAGTPDYKEHLVFLFGQDSDFSQEVETNINGVRCLYEQFEQMHMDKSFQAAALKLFGEIKGIIRKKYKQKVLIQIVVTPEGRRQVLMGLAGLVRTTVLENSNLVCQLICVDQDEKSQNIIEVIKEECKNPGDALIRYQSGKRYIMGWSELETPDRELVIPWKNGGIYLITGGVGGLGLVFAEEIAAKTKGSNLILTGRTGLSEDKKTKIENLKALGANIIYRQTDVTDSEAVDNLIKGIKSEFGRLDGIMHCAGIIRDNLIIKKDEEEFKEVLAPKVTGLLNLDEASKNMKLDFFIIFSSISACFGNVGQADYSTANAFMDAYAGYRSGLVESGHRSGVTLSFNWPLWQDGGMQIDSVTKRNMMQRGLMPMKSVSGINALYHAMDSGRDRILVIEGKVELIRKQLFSIPDEKGQHEADIAYQTAGSINENDKEAGHNIIKPENLQNIPDHLLMEKAMDYLKNLLSTVIKLPAAQIDTDAPMEKYGIDSIMSMELINQLEKTFGLLPKTLFFEYQNIRDLTGYFLETCRDKLLKELKIDNRINKQDAEVRKEEIIRPETLKPALTARKHRRFDYRFGGLKDKGLSGALDIAIIGLSGRYPQARNLKEFWDNLRNGKDCITEIPKDRWDHSLYFDEEKGRTGKVYSKWGGFIDGVDKFDPLFFNISPREAETMEPQERLFLECVHSVIEDAGYTRDSLREYKGHELGGNVGVFVGVTYEEYQLLGAQSTALGKPYALAGSPASIANRVSYFYNFHGPSMAVDTMCSSSLTAVHLACQSLIQGGCKLAIAGGVNVSIHPNKYLMLSQGKFLSSKGRCESFGMGGDGYVPGEGVGAVLLKPLSKAIEDKDQIYGVIKASVINHGGKTNGYTVPNPNAQAELVGQAFTLAGINPRTISYIETHGTGTSLGDPIEITGLNKVFSKYTQEKQFCAIGSVKSNIGHCESAAGIAGITKVLLQMKYKQLVPSLHSKDLNPYIDFKNTPFVVQQKLTEWKRPVVEVDGEIKECARVAGVSAFGAGGSNAHIVIEEYIPGPLKPKTDAVFKDKAIIVLSAKDEDRLKEQARQILAAIKDRKHFPGSLIDVAYTLQIGREAMEERLAFVAKSFKEFKEKLEGFLKDGDGAEGLYRGQVKRNRDVLKIWREDEDLQNTIEIWIAKEKYSKLLDLWVKGFDLDWNKFYKDEKPNRVSLPTYPFKGDRYWVSEIETIAPISVLPVSDAKLHPLLHKNTSDLSEQRFSSVFTGQEPFISDCSMKGRKVLPEMVCLEMARLAVEWAAGDIREAFGKIRLKNVEWSGPIVIGSEPLHIHIGLFPEENGEIAFEIYGKNETDKTETFVYCRGSAVIDEYHKVLPLDIKELQKQCRGNSLAAECFYDILREHGLDYSRSYRVIDRVFTGQRRSLIKLIRSDVTSGMQDNFTMHPNLLDSAFQASLGAMAGVSDFKLSLPLKLDEMNVFHGCSGIAWISVVKEDNAQKFDIDFCDEQGNICIQMKGLKLGQSTEPLDKVEVEEGIKGISTVQTEGTLRMMTFEEVWEEQAYKNDSAIEIKTVICFLSEDANKKAAADSIRNLDKKAVIIFVSQGSSYKKQSSDEYIVSKGDLNTYSSALESIRKEFGEIDSILYMWPIENRDMIYDYSPIVYILKAAVDVKLKPKRLILASRFENGLERCYPESWIGFERSLGMVLPDTQVAVILKEAVSKEPDSVKEWMKLLWKEMRSNKVQSVLFIGKKRYVKKIRTATLSDGDNLLRNNGTYLITGGLGGIGVFFAEYLSEKWSANLIITGRSALNDEKKEKIKAFQRLGSKVLYIQADVCDKESMKKGIMKAKEHFGKIHGVIHAAGIVVNKSIFEKDMESFEQVLKPKIEGTLVLDELLWEDEPDFICCFSSSAAILGDFGICDYSVANRFQMAYTRYRNDKQSKLEMKGKAVVINWPLWNSGGMSLGDDETAKMYLKSSGQRLLEAHEGVEIFEKILCQKNEQHLVLVGQPGRIQRFLGLAEERPAATAALNSTDFTVKGRRVEMRGLGLEECVEWDIKEIISKILKLSRDKLENGENLADFGFDSISLAEFAAALTKHYGIEITPALLFGYSTIEKLIKYLLNQYKDEINEFYREEADETRKLDENIPVKPVLNRNPGIRRTRFRAGETGNVSEPIAIIGMSGRFPKARNIHELWEILVNGQDVVEEIPLERFDWRKYYGDPEKEPGKMYCKWCGCIPGVSEFDPMFFEISPKEAQAMDPRQRLLLQEAWNALEDAGYGEKHIKNSKVGVFVGAEEGDYNLLAGDKGNITSGHNAVLAARLSYFLNLDGPNLSINTACSSGLVAVHQACMSLRDKECDTAIAAGVSIFFTPQPFIGMSQAGMLSRDGKCHTFDKKANGMVPGEAVAVVVLKRLSQAEADGDPIYAIIKGSGINYDGKTNGITAPSGVSQTKLLKSVYERYHVNPEEIEYIVTHGTGTKLGDPIEINALYDAFKEYTKKKEFCALTSTKTNLGHTLAASGPVSLISLVQAMVNGTIPASLNCEEENEYIKWKESPFYVNKTNKPWPEKEGKPRTGCVSAFGMGGTNVHMVIQSYTEKAEASGKMAPYHVLALSAKTQEALQQKINDMITFLENRDCDIETLLRISYTLLDGRHHFNFRCVVVIEGREDALYVLRKAAGKEKLPNIFQGKVGRGFTGQEAIYEYIQGLLAQSRSMMGNKEKYREILLVLADFYCQGYDVDWDQLFGSIKPRRLHLPTYPFEREKYWVTEGNKKNAFTVDGGQNSDQFNDELCQKLLDEVINEDISVDEAVQGIEDILS